MDNIHPPPSLSTTLMKKTSSAVSTANKVGVDGGVGVGAIYERQRIKEAADSIRRRHTKNKTKKTTTDKSSSSFHSLFNYGIIFIYEYLRPRYFLFVRFDISVDKNTKFFSFISVCWLFFNGPLAEEVAAVAS